MDDGQSGERRSGWDRRFPLERRRTVDRRCGDDRRGKPAETTVAPSEPSGVARPFGFRSFVDRRDDSDRRSGDAGGQGRREGDDRRATAAWPDDADVELTPEEVLALLHQPEK